MGSEYNVLSLSLMKTMGIKLTHCCTASEIICILWCTYIQRLRRVGRKWIVNSNSLEVLLSVILVAGYSGTQISSGDGLSIRGEE